MQDLRIQAIRKESDSSLTGQLGDVLKSIKILSHRRFELIDRQSEKVWSDLKFIMFSSSVCLPFTTCGLLLIFLSAISFWSGTNLSGLNSVSFGFASAVFGLISLAVAGLMNFFALRKLQSIKEQSAEIRDGILADIRLISNEE